MNAERLARTLQEYLSEAAGAVVLENGGLLFDLSEAKYSVSGESNKCLLHLWSTERNAVRRVVDAEVKHGTLRLAVQKLGQANATKLEICRERDRRTPSAKRAARAAYEHKLRRTIERHFPGFVLDRLVTGSDLEKSFGPVYARGVLRMGRSAYAVLGVNDQETQASVDAALTFGILWMDACRSAHPSAPNTAMAGHAKSSFVEGLILFVPAGCSALVRERMANLNRAAAKWRVFEFNERDDSLVEIDCTDRGNLRTRLTHAVNEEGAKERFAESIARMEEIVPNCEVVVLSAAEIGFRWRGLEFARARLGAGIPTFAAANATKMGHPTDADPGGAHSHFSQIRREVGHPVSYSISSSSFASFLSSGSQEIVFGVGAEERVLEERNFAVFAQLTRALCEARHVYGAKQDRLYRMHPESWLESMVKTDVSVIDERLEPGVLYAQVPAFSAADRAMVDVLAATRDGRLAVLELKADEDIHLPMQGLDYWARVEWHHGRGEFLRYGYFGGWELKAEAPLLFLVAPALRVHPTTDALLRYISPEIEWTLAGIDERWREGVRVVFRKRAQRGEKRDAELRSA